MSDTHDTHGGAHGHGTTEAEADRANVGVISLLFALTAILLAVAAYMLWIYFEREAERVNYEQVLSQPAEQLHALRTQESEWLGSYGVVDASKGVYRLPIHEGMQLFLKEAAARRSASQPQIVAPAAPPAPAEAPAEGEGAAPEGQQTK